MKKVKKKSAGSRRKASTPPQGGMPLMEPTPQEQVPSTQERSGKGSRWIGFLVLVLVSWFLFAPPGQKFDLSCTPGSPSFKKFDFEYVVDGIPAAWAYSDWTPSGKPGAPFADRNIMGPNLTIRGKVYEKGVGVQAPSRICFRLGRKVSKFSCRVGMDVNGKQGEGVVFSLLADGKEVLKTQGLTWDKDPVLLQANVQGVKNLVLACDPVGGFSSWCQGDWVDLKFER